VCYAIGGGLGSAFLVDNRRRQFRLTASEPSHVTAVLRREHDSGNLYTETYYDLGPHHKRSGLMPQDNSDTDFKGLKTVDRKVVRVQLPPPALIISISYGPSKI